MDLNPDDNYLPGTEEFAVHDDRADPDDMFIQGIAGTSEHPAELLDIPSGKSNSGPEPPHLVASGMYKDSSSACHGP